MDNFAPLYGQVLDSLALFDANLFCRNEMPSHRASQNEVCKRIIDEFYPLFVAALIDASTVTVPVIKVNALKHWWSEELTELKQRSIDTFHVWKDAGKPRSGTVFDLYMQNKYAYKLCINKMKNDSAQEITNDLHEALCDKDNSGFWKIWNSKFNIKKRNKPLTVNNLTNSQDIAEAFSSYFGNVCQPNSDVFNANKRSKFENEIQSYVGDFICPDDFFSVELLGKIVCELKLGRAPGIDGLTTEHFLHCHPSAIVLLTYLCNLILLCGHVPSQFMIGITYPIEKGSSVIKILSVDDFRGITISPLISKIFEKCILANFEKYFLSSDYQFGFKKKVGCSHAMFCLKSCIDYFVANNSSVNLCSIDVSKAFDRVNHFCLLLKLMSKCVPVNIIVLLNHWFSNSIALVCWNGVFSNPYTISAGVRQGGVLSLFLFACYVDNLILTLVNDGLGCHIGLQCMSVLMYADDLMLIYGSLTQLQAMINACTAELEALDLTVNVRKSVCMRIGKSYNFNPSRLMSVNNCNIEWSDNLVYLGINI